MVLNSAIINPPNTFGFIMYNNSIHKNVTFGYNYHFDYDQSTSYFLETSPLSNFWKMPIKFSNQYSNNTFKLANFGA